ncbi:MAG: histidine phosphatase family protein [Planctomycetes bacterium]|nr:histidine phosphatase family protein [Planctomycetota bacterium]
MNVCFFRHGLAVEHGTPPWSEEERPLTDEGRRKTRAAARGLKRLALGSDAILTSPLPRAAETAEILAEVLGLPRPRISERLLPGNTAAQILEVLKDTDTNSPILVGHEPGLSAAVSLFMSATDAGSIELRKAGMAFARLKTLSPRPRGSLVLVLTPGTLRKLAK